MLTYALVTPARNEGRNLPRLARCLLEQTAAPSEWVVVDDASTDDTAGAARELARAHPWIRVIAAPKARGDAAPLAAGRGAGRDIVAFKAGIGALRTNADVVVKLDADVSFAPDYFERLLNEFEQDPSLGIAGGTCYEHDGSRWRPYHVAGGHVRGATRTYRRACFEDVSPLEERIGWDGVDEIKAQLRGWTTRNVEGCAFYHHRGLGERDGAQRAWALQGQLAHYMGYRPSYLVLRALFRARREPAALTMIAAYLSARRRHEPRCPDDAVRSYVRREQGLRNLPLRVRQALGKDGS